MKYLFLGILKVVKVPRYSDLSLNIRNKRWAQSYESLMMRGAFTAALTALQGITHTSNGHRGTDQAFSPHAYE